MTYGLSPPRAVAIAPRFPRAVGPYRLVRAVGRGGLGRVFLAVDERSGGRVALKLLEQAGADSIATRRLAREFEALRGIDHPNVVRVLDAGLADEPPFLVMEFVAGVPLRAWLDGRCADEPPTEDSGEGPVRWTEEMDTGDLPRPSRPPLDDQLAALNEPRRTARLRDAVRQVARGLAFIHQRGLVHRDVKPGNVLVDLRGRAKLLDFGLVKTQGEGSQVTLAGRIVGTYLYMSPEQATGKKVDGRADLYSLGAVIYEMLTGVPPHGAAGVIDLIAQIVEDVPAPPLSLNPGADPTLARVAERLLAKDPAARFQTAAEVLGALGEA